MAFDGTLLKALHLDPMEHLAGRQIADLEAEQAVDVDKAEGLRRVDGKRANGRAEGTNRLAYFLGLGINDRQQRRLQPRQVSGCAVETAHRVMRAAFGYDLGDYVSARRIHDVPMSTLQGRDVEDFAVRCERHAVATTGQSFFPEGLFRKQIQAIELGQRGKVQPLRAGIGADTLYVFWFVRAACRSFDALDEGVILIHVEDENAGPAQLEVVADAGDGDIKQMPFLRLGLGRNSAAGRP